MVIVRLNHAARSSVSGRYPVEFKCPTPRYLRRIAKNLHTNSSSLFVKKKVEMLKTSIKCGKEMFLICVEGVVDVRVACFSLEYQSTMSQLYSFP